MTRPQAPVARVAVPRGQTYEARLGQIAGIAGNDVMPRIAAALAAAHESDRHVGPGAWAYWLWLRLGAGESVDQALDALRWQQSGGQ